MHRLDSRSGDGTPRVTVDPVSAQSLFVALVERESPYLKDWNPDDASVLED